MIKLNFKKILKLGFGSTPPTQALALNGGSGGNRLPVPIDFSQRSNKPETIEGDWHGAYEGQTRDEGEAVLVIANRRKDQFIVFYWRRGELLEYSGCDSEYFLLSKEPMTTLPQLNHFFMKHYVKFHEGFNRVAFAKCLIDWLEE